jgi:hypothetical protein
MKRKTFLQKVSTLLIVLVMLVGIQMVMTSCEEVQEACERDNVGTVTVVNETGYSIYTDVTWGDYNTNYEKMLYDNGSYKYSNVQAGSIEIWITFDGEDWSYNYENLSACEDMTYRWYLTYNKSANGCPFILELPDGTTVIPTRKHKK